MELQSRQQRGSVRAGMLDSLLADREFLVFAEPRTLMAELPHVRTAEGRAIAAAYTASTHLHHSRDPATRRRLLAVDLARLAVAPAGGAAPPGQPWQPVWASGSHLSPALVQSIKTGGMSSLGQFAMASVAGRHAAVVAGHGWDEASGRYDSSAYVQVFDALLGTELARLAYEDSSTGYPAVLRVLDQLRSLVLAGAEGCSKEFDH